MGYGYYIGNMSVHWEVAHHNGPERRPGVIRGRDPIAFDQIGADAARGLSAGSFRVALRFGTYGEAQTALSAASVVEENGSYFLKFDVPALQRTEAQADALNPPPEVRVDW
jgi:hypothetical protein